MVAIIPHYITSSITYYKPGPVTNLKDPISYRILKPESDRSKLSYVVFGRAYVNGNIVEGNDKVTKDNWDGGVQIEDKKGNLMSYEQAKPYFDAMRADQPFPMAKITILPAMAAHKYVLTNAGANLPKRDPVDTRVIEQVKTGKITYIEGAKLPEKDLNTVVYQMILTNLGIITDISQVGGYPEYKGTPYIDSDDDGMPDAMRLKLV